eukprot:14116152-Alexandrium_andersonii.AAC.1
MCIRDSLCTGQQAEPASGLSVTALPSTASQRHARAHANTKWRAGKQLEGRSSASQLQPFLVSRERGKIDLFGPEPQASAVK